jgi:hypothetical protein
MLPHGSNRNITAQNSKSVAYNHQQFAVLPDSCMSLAERCWLSGGLHVMAARVQLGHQFPIERGASGLLERPPPIQLFVPARTEDWAPPDHRRAATTTAVNQCPAYCGQNNPHYTI